MRMEISMEKYKAQVEAAVSFLELRLPERPEILIQTGTGLGALAYALEERTILPYADIPGFPRATVTSHEGNLMFGRIRERRVALLQGRFHYYEGYSTREVAFGVRVLALLGVRAAIITNAAGGLNPAFRPGSIMVIRDHLYLLGENPLRGPNVDDWGPRFPDLSTPYAPELRDLALRSASRLGLSGVEEGVYVCVPGPSLETPAETRHLCASGADAVGMSSIPEVIVALHAGLRVLGLSVVANVNDPDNFVPILLEDLVRAAQAVEPRLQQLILEIIREL